MAIRYDIMALGELLIDFTEAGTSDSGNRLFEQNPGGAPANLLVVASQMGYKTAFVGKVGKDMHGDFLRNVLEEKGICTDYLVQDENVFTTLAFVAIGNNGERKFSFARKPGADTCLSIFDLNIAAIQSCKIFHVGSLSLTNEPSRSATYEAVRMAKEAGVLISYDPNYRSSLWENEKAAVKNMRDMIQYADMMKISDEECILLTGEEDYIKAAAQLLEIGPRIIAVTLGKKGVLLIQKDKNEIISGFKVSAVDTTGAGDSFWGGFLSRFLQFNKEFLRMNWEDWKACALQGNAVAALCVQKRGGIPAIPTKEEVVRFLSNQHMI